MSTPPVEPSRVPTSIFFPRDCDVDEVLRSHGLNPQLVYRNPAHASLNEAAERFGLTSEQFLCLVKANLFPGPEREGEWSKRQLLEFMNGAVIEPQLGLGQVYFIAMGDFIKIGFSTSPEIRRADLQVGSPYDLQILATFWATEEHEQLMHGRFAALRVKSKGPGSEWFKGTKALGIFIWWLCRLHKVKPRAALLERIEGVSSTRKDSVTSIQGGSRVNYAPPDIEETAIEALRRIARGRIDTGRPLSGEGAKQLARAALVKCRIGWGKP
jgi:Meiotically up-regulated gene 113